ncbi:MAG: bifunctional homocysteine S-methyltransferase/5,10-methylenetetrahydrofolate reductase protein, partial [Firmicutes bacterium]|nr:bifunctional homocysteine S-methyltransferase/5,10-methylenetetrahydrofolate reductase protein [Bacillota bacterium]
KVAVGAEFFLTQPVFADQTIDFLPRIEKKEHVKLLGGIMPLVSYRNAQFLNNEVPGIQVPEKIMNRFDRSMDRETAENLGIEIAVEIANRIREYVDGFYFITPFNRVEMIIKIIQKLGL